MGLFLASDPAVRGESREVFLLVVFAACAGGAGCVAMTASRSIGTPIENWTWALTAMQLVSLWGQTSRSPWGWVVGLSLQPVWAGYALLTGQVGMAVGCAVIAVLQLRGLTISVARDARSRARAQEAPRS